jgi:hypothetical protein
MNAAIQTLNEAHTDTARYARCIKASKKATWEIDRDVLRGREFDFSHKFLPDGLSKVDELAFLTEAERRTLSQVQGRTYAYLFGLVERFIGANHSTCRANTISVTRWHSRRWCVSATKSSSTGALPAR